jgi:hypothetical protein
MRLKVDFCATSSRLQQVQPSPAESSSAKAPNAGGSDDVDRSQAQRDHEAAQSMMLVFRPQALPHPDEPEPKVPTPPARPPPSSRLYMGQSSTLWLTQAAARLARGGANVPMHRELPLLASVMLDSPTN